MPLHMTAASQTSQQWTSNLIKAPGIFHLLGFLSLTPHNAESPFTYLTADNPELYLAQQMHNTGSA